MYVWMLKEIVIFQNMAEIGESMPLSYLLCRFTVAIMYFHSELIVIEFVFFLLLG